MNKDQFKKQAHFSYEDVLDLISYLRSDDGCPWDRVQTHQSVRRGVIEEAYEAVDAVDRGNLVDLEEELGDVMKTGILWDLDGTLLDTMEDLADAVNFALGEFGYPTRSVEEVRCFVGNGARRLIERRVTELIVLRLLIRIGKNCVSLVYFLKLGFSLLVPGVKVGVVFLRLCAIRLLDFVQPVQPLVPGI